MEKKCYLGTLDGIKDYKGVSGKEKNRKSFILSYNKEKPLLYSNAKITIGNKTVETNRAIWDTGATITAISNMVSKQLKGMPYETGDTIGATGREETNIYRATVELPGGIVLNDIEVWDVSLSEFAAEVIIGMDIISRGRLVVETVKDIPTFSFCIEY